MAEIVLYLHAVDVHLLILVDDYLVLDLALIVGHPDDALLHIGLIGKERILCLILGLPVPLRSLVYSHIVAYSYGLGGICGDVLYIAVILYGDDLTVGHVKAVHVQHLTVGIAACRCAEPRLLIGADAHTGLIELQIILAVAPVPVSDEYLPVLTGGLHLDHIVYLLSVG